MLLLKWKLIDNWALIGSLYFVKPPNAQYINPAFVESEGVATETWQTCNPIFFYMALPFLILYFLPSVSHLRCISC